MFKLLLHSLLGLSMIFSSIGVGVYKHYCHKKLVATTVFVKFAKCCGGKEMPPGCCQDEFEFHQLDVDYHASDAVVVPTLSLISSWIVPDKVEIPEVEDFIQDFKLFHFRPPLLRLNLSVWIQTFLI